MANQAVNIIIPSTSTSNDFPIDYGDVSIDEGTIYAIDFSNPESWVKQSSAVTGDNVKNIAAGNLLSISGNLPFNKGGLGFSATTSQTITLPDAAKITSGVQDYLFGLWITPGTQTQVSCEIGGYHYLDTGPYGIRTITAKDYRLICSGVTYGSNITQGALAALHLAMEKKDDGSYMAHFFRDGLPIASLPVTTPSQQPSQTIANAQLGDLSGSGTPGYWIGTIHRSFLTTKHRNFEEISEFVKRDWDFNREFFV